MKGKKYEVTMELNMKDLPDESTLIENLILNGNLGTFLYTVANDILEGRYNLEAGSTRIILNQLIDTVSSIFSTVGSMDTNIQTMTDMLNTHTGVLNSLEPVEKQINLVREEATSLEEPITLDLGGPEAVSESMFVGSSDEGDMLTLPSGFEDVFDLDDMDS